MTGMGTLEVAGEPVRLYVAEAAGQDAPGVALYHAWWGLNDDVIAFAHRLAAAGFYVLAPDLYRGKVTASIDQADRLSSSIDQDAVNAIALAAIDRLAERAGAPTRIGTVGFSFGAAWAVWTAGRRVGGVLRLGRRPDPGRGALGGRRALRRGGSVRDGRERRGVRAGAPGRRSPGHDPPLPGHRPLVRGAVP